MLLPNTETPLKGDLMPNKLFNNPLASYSLMNLDIALPQTAQFDENNLLFFVFSNQVFLLSIFFLHLKQYNNIVY